MRRCRGSATCSAAIVAAAVREAEPARRAGHRQDAQGHRRRPPHLPRGRADRRGGGRGRGGAARPDRCAGLLRARPTGAPSPGSRRPSPRSRCSATATSGRPRTRCAMVRADRVRRRRRRAGLPRAGRGCSPTSRRPSPARPARVRPTLGEVTATMRRHAEYLVEFYGDERKACRDIRKHIAWYLKGFPAGSTGAQPARAGRLAGRAGRPARHAGPDAPWPGEAAEGQRGRAGSPRTGSRCPRAGWTPAS